MLVIDRTRQLLAAEQELRDSDKKLLLAYWRQQGLYLNNEQIAVFMSCTPAESITRARRELKEDYPASEAVDQARFEKFKEHKNEKAISWLNED